MLLTEADEPTEPDLAVLRDFAGPGVTVHVGDPKGNVSRTVQPGGTSGA